MSDCISGIITPAGIEPGSGAPNSPGVVKYVSKTISADFGTDYPPTTKIITSTEVDWSTTSFRATVVYVIPDTVGRGYDDVTPGPIYMNGTSLTRRVNYWSVPISGGSESAYLTMTGYSDRVMSEATITDTWHTNKGHTGPANQTIDLNVLIVAY